MENKKESNAEKEQNKAAFSDGGSKNRKNPPPQVDKDKKQGG